MQAAAGVFTLRIADRTIDSQTATTTLVQLSGTPIGRRPVWRVVIDGDASHVFETTVGGPIATVQQIAADLAAKINAAGQDPLSPFFGYLAAAEGTIVAIVNPAGTGFQASFAIVTSATAPTAERGADRGCGDHRGADRHAGRSRHLDVSRSAAATTASSSMPTASAPTRPWRGLAAALAAAVNADAALPNYLAISVGDTIVIIDRAATPVRPSILLSVGLASGTGTAAPSASTAARRRRCRSRSPARRSWARPGRSRSAAPPTRCWSAPRSTWAAAWWCRHAAEITQALANAIAASSTSTSARPPSAACCSSSTAPAASSRRASAFR